MPGKKFQGELADYDPRYMRCRGLRNHTWQFKTDYNVTTGPKGKIIEFSRTLHCAGCTTNRIDTYGVNKDGTFTPKGRKYEYAEGYQVSRDNPLDSEKMRDSLMMLEMAQDLDEKLLNRLLSMRPDVAAQIKRNGALSTHLRAV